MTKQTGRFVSLSRENELIGRLFEMGFESQLHEITHRLPPTRQSLLFSATLPTTVAEFAQASLNNPALIRLDADFNLSPDLTLSFYLVKPSDKDAVLMIALQSLLRSEPTGTKQRQGQAIVFCATKHHVEYLTTLISGAGYTTSSVFGSLDQIARQQQLHRFRDGESQVLVVTDVAARGLDIPVMDNVINYDYPPNARLFIHRVGRTARAGQKGRAVSLVVKDDVPYLCDLEDVVGLNITDPNNPLLGSVPRALVDDTRQSLRGMEQDDGQAMAALREVMRKGQGMYERSRTKASGRAYRKAKDVIQVSMGDSPEHMHPDFKSYAVVGHSDLVSSLERFRPAETVMEMGNKGKSIVGLMSERRKVMARKRKVPPTASEKQITEEPPASTLNTVSYMLPSYVLIIQASLPVKDFRDPSFFLQHERSHHDRDKG
jgi:ATP-dependent RNA helicase DDX54/DBP10